MKLKLNLRPNKIDFYLIFERLIGLIKPGSKVLDFASAGYKHAHYFVLHDYYAADISFESLSQGKRKGSNVFPVVADLRKIPFKAESFDLIISSHTLEWLDKSFLLQAISDLGKLTKPGGVFAFSYLNPPAEVWEKALADLKKEFCSVDVFRYRGKLSQLYEDCLFQKVDNVDFPRRHRYLHKLLLLLSFFVWVIDFPFKRLGNAYFVIARKERTTI
ncbi:MAG: class I SAM-dependent methyltransferase [Thermincola sp.]|jgi:SAM-dependent methyltransferase|nr:class I SAM-dependent methyltransferase [Thermincola sp.]MDT3703469.1 class I SAM-dependent methyltransferase [Thermincola sp.]